MKERLSFRSSTYTPLRATEMFGSAFDKSYADKESPDPLMQLNKIRDADIFTVGGTNNNDNSIKHCSEYNIDDNIF